MTRAKQDACHPIIHWLGFFLMNTVEELRKLSEKAILLKEKGLLPTLDERGTERELIEPFIEALGYKLGLLVGEVEPQPKVPFAATTVKCDYAIKRNGTRVILIEAKRTSVSLGAPGQLSDYFEKESEVWLGIFTNGIKYRFYSGYIQESIKRMDPQPFLVLDFLNFDEADAETVSEFAKDRFDPYEVRGLAQKMKFERKYKPAIRDALREELEEPSEELFQLLINKIDTEDEELERLKPLVKKVANQLLKLPSPPNGPTPPTTERELFLTGKYGVNAKGYYDSREFVVLEGSKASKIETPTLPLYAHGAVKKRKELQQSGVLKDDGETFVFTQNCAFNSPSLASSVCLGRNSTGWTEWKDKNGLPLRDLVKKW